MGSFTWSRREHESAVAEHKAAAAQLDAERSDFLAQVEHLKEQVHDKERHAQEIEEQVLTSPLTFWSGQVCKFWPCNLFSLHEQ